MTTVGISTTADAKRICIKTHLIIFKQTDTANREGLAVSLARFDSVEAVVSNRIAITNAIQLFVLEAATSSKNRVAYLTATIPAPAAPPRSVTRPFLTGFKKGFDTVSTMEAALELNNGELAADKLVVVLRLANPLWLDAPCILALAFMCKEPPTAILAVKPRIGSTIITVAKSEIKKIPFMVSICGVN